MTIFIVKKLVEKGAVKRRDPFICQAAVSRKSVQREEATELIDKLFDGSAVMARTITMAAISAPACTLI